MQTAQLTADLRQQVTVVIPAKDEARNIGDVIRAVRPAVFEVLVVDGHSSDGTGEVARQAGARVIQDRGKGKGDAIRVSIPEISSSIAVFMDADGSHDPLDIPKLVAPILSGDFDHVSGSRLLGGSSELHGGFDEFLRLTGSSFITACVNYKHGLRLSDSQNGFRAIRTEVLAALGLRENITTIEQEMIFRTLNLGYRLGEVPTHEHRRKFGESKIRISRVWHRYAWSLGKHLLLPGKRD